jgi:hypothetical protein
VLVLLLLAVAAGVGAYVLLADSGEDARASAEECHAQVDPLLTELNGLNARLSVGLTYSDYSSKVGDIAVVYDRLDAARLDGECVAIALDAEKSFRQYARAQDMWSNCIQSVGCKTDGPVFGPRLQQRWADAGDFLDKANNALKGLDEEAG